MRRIEIIALTCLTVAASSPAHATLGEKTSSVETDRVRLKARMNIASVSAASVRELVQDNGTVTRQYSNAAGKVFAVTWTGPARPDLKQLFGNAYFTRLQTANAKTSRVYMRRALAVTSSDFVVRTGGHPGVFWGYAVLPAEVPAGFDNRELMRGGE